MGTQLWWSAQSGVQVSTRGCQRPPHGDSSWDSPLCALGQVWNHGQGGHIIPLGLRLPPTAGPRPGRARRLSQGVSVRRAVLHEDSTLSLETLRRMLLFLLFTRMCVTEVWCPFIIHTGFFEKRGFHRRMRGS